MTLGFVNVRSRFLERTGLDSTISRREVFLWIAFTLLANEILQLVDAQIGDSLIIILGTQNYILWLAGYAFVYRLWLSSRESPADRLDLWFAALTCLAISLVGFVPHRWGLGLIATAVAGYLMWAYRGDSNLRSAGGLMFAMSAHLVWGPIFFQLSTPEVVRGDAAIVGGLLKVLRPDILWRDTTFYAPNGHGLIIAGACSSFQNISIALLACATVTMLSRPVWIKRDIGVIALATLAMIAINTARLCLLAWDHVSYEYWHNGDGAGIFLFIQTIVALAIAFWGATTGRQEA
ncbi:MAG: hypothetical protein WB816_14415 [Methylocystis sp.]